MLQQDGTDPESKPADLVARRPPLKHVFLQRKNPSVGGGESTLSSSSTSSSSRLIVFPKEITSQKMNQLVKDELKMKHDMENLGIAFDACIRDAMEQYSNIVVDTTATLRQVKLKKLLRQKSQEIHYDFCHKIVAMSRNVLSRHGIIGDGNSNNEANNGEEEDDDDDDESSHNDESEGGNESEESSGFHDVTDDDDSELDDSDTPLSIHLSENCLEWMYERGIFKSDIFRAIMDLFGPNSKGSVTILNGTYLKITSGGGLVVIVNAKENPYRAVKAYYLDESRNEFGRQPHQQFQEDDYQVFMIAHQLYHQKLKSKVRKLKATEQKLKSKERDYRVKELKLGSTEDKLKFAEQQVAMLTTQLKRTEERASYYEWKEGREVRFVSKYEFFAGKMEEKPAYERKRSIRKVERDHKRPKKRGYSVDPSFKQGTLSKRGRYTVETYTEKSESPIYCDCEGFTKYGTPLSVIARDKEQFRDPPTPRSYGYPGKYGTPLSVIAREKNQFRDLSPPNSYGSPGYRPSSDDGTLPSSYGSPGYRPSSDDGTPPSNRGGRRYKDDRKY